MSDSLRVRLGEANSDLVGAPESLRHSATIRAPSSPGWYDWVMSQQTNTSREDRDVLARLADRGEQTLARLADLPGGTKALKAVNDLRTRVDELGKKVRGIDELELRITKLEKEVATLRRTQKPKTGPKPPDAGP